LKKLAFVIVLIATTLAPTQAQAAQTTFVGGPLTNLDSPASVRIALSNVPGGLYLMQCVEGIAGARPTICNTAAELWVSTDARATVKPTDGIVFKPTATFTGADCTKVKCGIFIRYDHFRTTDTSEDQFIALTFKSGTPTAPTLAPDEITAMINGAALSSRTPFKLAYRGPATLSATSKAGAALTYASLAPACTLTGMKITALKGTGYCDIAITSAGSANAATVTAHFPIELTIGTQTIGKVSASSTKKTKLPAATNFGQPITYLGTGSCTTTKRVVTAKKGTCTIVAGARGITDLYEPLNERFVIKVK
jgi:hypothetical protein